MISIVGPNRNTNQTPAPGSLRQHSLHGSSLIAIRHEGVRLATPGGLINAQLVKILRIDHTPVPQHQLNPAVMPMRWLPSRSTSTVKPPLKPSKPAIEARRKRRATEQDQVGLRSVGEVLTDHTGHLYEVQGEELRTLGELVRDPEGRLFEVCNYTNNRGINEAPELKPAAEQREQKKSAQIPRLNLNSHQPNYSREEVLYDMKGVFGTLTPNTGLFWRLLFIYPLRLFKTLAIVATSRWQLRKWRALLEGKSADEQLWTIKPPRGFAYLPAVREWAETTLTKNGYDSKKMLLEWEIFWRRNM